MSQRGLPSLIAVTLVVFDLSKNPFRLQIEPFFSSPSRFPLKVLLKRKKSVTEAQKLLFVHRIC